MSMGKHTAAPALGSLFEFRKPAAKDGIGIHGLVDRSKPLDVNSVYAYLILCEHFSETCVVAQRADTDPQAPLSGFVSAYRPPERNDTLFVWQVAVDASARGKGLALRMLQSLLSRPGLREVRWIETTINPSNRASIALFERLAHELDVPIENQLHYPEVWFAQTDAESAHEAEYLYRLGPLPLPV
jgi:L-2,4-diaminobutyric acid acetyltransferase